MGMDTFYSLKASAGMEGSVHSHCIVAGVRSVSITIGIEY